MYAIRSYYAVSALYKVYIIDEVHMLSKAAFNGLLKILEEPPAHVVFVFATTEPNRIPDTILSRVQRFDFRMLTDRITSYNVCYTKLLRRRSGNSRAPCSLPTSWPGERRWKGRLPLSRSG